MLIFKYSIEVAKYPSRNFALTHYQWVKEVALFVCFILKGEEKMRKRRGSGCLGWALDGERDVGGMLGSSGPEAHWPGCGHGTSSSGSETHIPVALSGKPRGSQVMASLAVGKVCDFPHRIRKHVYCTCIHVHLFIYHLSSISVCICMYVCICLCLSAVCLLHHPSRELLSLCAQPTAHQCMSALANETRAVSFLRIILVSLCTRRQLWL